MENATVLWKRTQRRAPKCLQIIPSPFSKKTMAEDMNESDGDVGPIPMPAGSTDDN